MLKRFAAIAGVLCLIFVAFATLSPIDLRPTTELGLGWEHMLAFSVIAALLAYAFPRHIWQVFGLVFVAAIFLEAMQLVVPGRHARLTDLAAKIFGAIVGFVAVRFADRVFATRK